jgi:hypothetical protein
MHAAVVAVMFVIVGRAVPVYGQDITLATSAGGLAVGGVKPAYSTGFGSLNGLGVGVPASGLSVLQATGSTGVLYITPYSIVISGASAPNRALVRAYVSTNFVHPSILQVYSCTSSCTSAASFAALATSLVSQTDVIAPGVSSNQTLTRYLALFVSKQNGAGAFTGLDSATVTFNVYRENNGTLQHTYTLALNNQSVQTALRLSLATAPGGRTVATGSDFTLNYGTVNALGIGAAAGLSVISVSGGSSYSSPFYLQPTFSSFSSTTGSLRAYVSTDFIHPSQLELRDSSDGATFSPLSKSSTTPTALTSAASGANVTRYLGLFVSNANGAGVFTGSDNATVTFTLVIP